MARPPQPLTTVRTFEELNQAIKASGLPADYYRKVSLNQLLVDLTNSNVILAPTFYKQLQDFMVATEADTGIPVTELAQQPQVFPAAEKAYKFGQAGPDTTGGGGGGGGGRAASEAAAAAEAAIAAREETQRQWQAQQDAIQRQWQEQQNELNRQAQLRLQRLGDLTGLVGQFAGFQAKARETLAGLQGDPFRFAQAKLGLAPAGVTPMQSFAGQTREFANQPLPQVSANAPMPDIEAAIQRLQGLSAPQA